MSSVVGEPEREAERRIAQVIEGHHNELDLLGLGLSAVPATITQLTNLTRLDLQGNELTSVPDTITQLTNLTRLNLQGNRLASVPDTITQLTNLTELYLHGNQLTTVPGTIARLIRLTRLNLQGNRLTSVPETIGLLTNLTHLYLGSNQLTSVPDAFGLLTNLTHLYLGSNRLTSVPQTIGQLTNLVELYLGGNQLTHVPGTVTQLTNLTQLYLHGNQLTAVPETIARLTRLTRLNLQGNRLTSVPATIGQLTNLVELYLGNNQLTAVPETIARLTNLTRLDLDGNEHLSSPPQEIQAQGTEAVLAFLRALAASSATEPATESSIERWASKILIVGEAMVGKTSLVKQLFGETFDPREPQTHGLRVRSLLLSHPERAGVEMALDVWDFGGQLEYRATQRFYLTDRSLFVLVWNARARADDGKVTAWLDAITARAPGAPILVVASHSDERSPAALPGDLRSRYPSIIGLHTIDSSTGLGIDFLHQKIARHAAELPLMGTRWPSTWDAAARALGALAERSVTTHRVFAQMASAGVTDPSAHQVIARMLHDLGKIAYFPDIPGLENRILLKPEWLDDRITQAIDSAAVTKAGGVLSRAERHRLWGELAESEDDPELPDRLIRIMEAFDLAYRTGDADTSTDVALIVDRLPLAPPADLEHVWGEARQAPGVREIAIIFKLASRQAGIPTSFIAREHRYTTELHWRHGALLHDRDPAAPAWALLTDDGREQPTLTLRVAGTYPVRLYSVLTEAFETIIRAHYPGLVEQRLVPCACRAGGEAACSHAFTLKELQGEATAEDGDGRIRCPESRRRIEAALMLDGLRGTGLAKHLGAIEHKLDAQAGTLNAVSSTLNAVDAREQKILNGIRILLEHRATAGVHCPALYSIQQNDRRLRRPRISVTLWCEWPSEPHPLGSEGRYTINPIPDALIRYLPYLRGLITVLGLASPTLGAGGIALSNQAKDRLEVASRTLGFIAKHTDTAALASEHEARPSNGGGLRAETGADFRALRYMLQSLDPEEKWGRLSPVSRPEDQRIIYLCQRHIRELAYPYKAAEPPA